MKNFEKWYDANHKKILILPAIVLLISILYISFFYVHTGDIINKDVSLTGGTSITVLTQEPAENLKEYLSKSIQDFEIRTISDNSEKQLELIITVKSVDEENIKTLLEGFLGHKLTSKNSSMEKTSASLSEDFFKQLVIAITIAFFWMAAVVFLIFSKGAKTKIKIVFANLFFGFFLGKFLFKLNSVVSGIIFTIFAIYLLGTYIRKSVPSFAVILSAFADIIMTLAVINFMGMKLSTAGIVAFLMLIGYSVDTDILLTTRLLKGKEDTNKALFSAFKTGTTMTTTSLIAVAASLIIVYSFNSVLNQIFIILLIGLIFDLFNTWITNASIIKWYVEKK